MKFLRRCWGFVIPLLLLPLVGMTAVAAGINRDLVSLLSMLATLLILASTLVYIVLIDSTKRWPGVRARDRFARVMTFYRD